VQPDVLPKTKQNRLLRNLNIGCGDRFHRDWCNVDLVSKNDQVLQHDIRTGLPFEDDSFDAVYHSHVLEHLTPKQGESLIRECCRVLVPAGTLRIVVPDLERISQIYLRFLQQAWAGDKKAEENYEWMKLEMLDQMVRQQSGGQMGPYMIDSSKSNSEFVRSRIGSELESCENQFRTDRPRTAFTVWLGNLRTQLA